MHSLDYDVLKQLGLWCQEQRTPWLCTIVTTTGSSPRPVGSMLGFVDGISVGTLSGGCVEEDLLAKLQAGDISGEKPQRLTYGVTAAENERLGLPCGGRMEIVVEQLQVGKQDWLFEALAYLDQRQLCQRQLDLDSGVSTLSTQDSHHPLQINEHQLQQSLGPRMRMLLVGAGQLAQVLSSLALAMDFDVLVTDPREDAIAQWQGPDVPLLHGLPDDIIATQAFDRQSVIITLTHDPRIDDMALMEALETDAWYVGALGSVRTTEQRLQRLHELGLADSAIARLHAPVGLDIGSKTPWEIAVAIMAEITQLQRRP